MLFKSKENQCLLQILEILDKRPRTYGYLFKETKVSHTTLQSVLRSLTEKNFIEKGHPDYGINPRGKEFLKSLIKLKSLLG